jgi:hypothetical protein
MNKNNWGDKISIVKTKYQFLFIPIVFLLFVSCIKKKENILEIVPRIDNSEINIGVDNNHEILSENNDEVLNKELPVKIKG